MTDVPEDVLAEWGATLEPSDAVREHLAAESGRTHSRSRTAKRRLRQVRAWVRYRRWRGRCDECGHMFLPGHSVHSFGNRDGKQWHDKCIGYVTFRRTADEQLVVLDLITDVWGITMRDVTALMEGRAEREGYETSNAYNLGWRVMYAIDKRREAKSKDSSDV